MNEGKLEVEVPTLATMSEEFHVEWNDFQANASKAFGLFRNESYLHDVTLVSSDRKHVSAHKLVLSASSEYFKDIFQQTKHGQPILCLEGVNSKELKNVLDYIYEGQVKINQEELESFMEISQRFQLEGLMFQKENTSLDTEEVLEIELDEDEDAEEEEKKEDISNDTKVEENKEEIVKGIEEEEKKKKFATILDSFEDREKNRNEKLEKQFSAFIKEECPEPTKENKMKSRKRSMGPTESMKIQLHGTESPTEIEHILDKNITRKKGIWTCKVCGKMEKRYIRNLKFHVETHLAGLSLPCKSCERNFTTTNALRIHKSNYNH